MLRCAGCLEPVSVWAARCSRCGESTASALTLPGDEGDEARASGHSQQPGAKVPEGASSDGGSSTDEGRLPRSRTRRTRRTPIPTSAPPRRVVAVGVAVLAVVLAGVAFGLRAVGGSSCNRAEAAACAVQAMPGRVLTETSGGALGFNEPSGQQLFLKLSLGPPANGDYAVALDRHEIVNAAGELFSLNGQAIRRFGQIAGVSPLREPTSPDPFADGDQAVVAKGPSYTTATSGISIEQLSHPGWIPLGTADADDVAGDPQTLGAFVSQPEVHQPPVPPPGIPVALADTDVELRVAGRPTVVLATAAELDRYLHEPASTPVHLEVFPSPSGSRLVVVVEPVDVSDAEVAMVAIDRNGALLGSVSESLAPASLPPSWSPDGSSLAYAAVGTAGVGVAVWTPGKPPSFRSTPLPGGLLGSCLWSPAGRDVLCTTNFGTGDDAPIGGPGWIVADSMGGPLYFVHSLGMPITWL